MFNQEEIIPDSARSLLSVIKSLIGPAPKQETVPSAHNRISSVNLVSNRKVSLISDDYELLGSDKQFDCIFEDLLNIYHGRDTNIWTPQIDEKDYVQSKCNPPNAEVVQVKIRTKVMACLRACIDAAIDLETRKKWDNVLYDFKLH